VHQALAPRELGSQVLGSQVLESQVLESQVLESQELCHQLQLLKQPNSGPEPEWVLEAFPLTGSGSVLGAFLVSVSELESEVFLELPFPLQPRQQPRPRQPSSVLEGQEPWEGWCRGSETEWQVSQV